MATRALATVSRLLAGSLWLSVASCTTYESDLQSGQRAFEQSEHERAIAIFRMLEPDMSRLSTVSRAHYAYLRGMTDYRIGYRSEARHWLALASALDQKTPGSLPPDWEQRMSESLKDLNEQVYAGGVGSLDEPRRSEATEVSAGESGGLDTAPEADAMAADE
jgi:hypothetical protein